MVFRPFQKDFLRLHAKEILFLQRFFDIFLILSLYSLFSYFYTGDNNSSFQNTYFVLVGLLHICFNVFGLYKSYRSKSLLKLSFTIFIIWIVIFSIFVLYLCLCDINIYYTSNFFILWFISVYLYLLTHHVFLRSLLRRERESGNNFRSLLFYGNYASKKNISDHLFFNKWTGYKIVAWFSPDFNIHKSNSNYINCLGGVDQLKTWFDTNRVDKIVFNTSNLSNYELSNLLQIFGDTSIPVSCNLDWANTSMRLNPDFIGQSLLLELWGSENYFLILAFKRIFDFLFSFLFLFLLSPILILICFGIRITSEGSVLFKQSRYGLDGKRFFIYKFRTMTVNDSGDKPGLLQAQKVDSRVTKLGKFLRSWSLDELPQLYNVLNGSMSLIGPRPHAVEHNELYRKMIPGYMQRHAFKPGITGLAQINDLRGATNDLNDMKLRIEADLQYQRDWSIFLDISILFRTLFKLKSKNSY